jgi:hypothetical protein
MNGSTIFTGIKSVEILVAVKFLYNGDRCTQRFELSANKPVLNHAYDKRFDIYDKLNAKISEVMLSNLSDIFVFYSRINEKNYISIDYDINGKISKALLNNYFFVIASFLPGFAGCEYCVHAGKNGEFIYCNQKNQTIVKGLRRCMIFKQKSNLFKT